MTPETTQKPKVVYLNYLIYLATIPMVAEDKKITDKKPEKFNKAWNHQDAKPQRKWHNAMYKELTNITKQQVWQKTSKSLMPPNCIKFKQAF